jgi:hypothetical protein
MKIGFLICLTILIASQAANSQDIRMTNSFVIAVNDKVVVSSLARARLIVNKIDGKKEILDVGYVPGDLYFNSAPDKEKVYSDSATDVILEFDNYEYPKGKQTVRNYQIHLNKKWFQYSFIVLRIYDSDQKKHINGLASTHRTNYSYILDFPGYSITDAKKE